MNQKNEFYKHLFERYYHQLQTFQEQLGDDKDPAVYERLTILEYWQSKEPNAELIRMIEHWIWTRQSLFEYFCSTQYIDHSLESIITQYGQSVELKEYIIKISEKRVRHVKEVLDSSNAHENTPQEQSETGITKGQGKEALTLPILPLIIQKDDEIGIINIQRIDKVDVNPFSYVLDYYYKFDEECDFSQFDLDLKLCRSDGIVVHKAVIWFPAAHKGEKCKYTDTIYYQQLLNDLEAGYTFELKIETRIN